MLQPEHVTALDQALARTLAQSNLRALLQRLGLRTDAAFLVDCVGALAQQIAERSADATRCQIVGISGAQGTGKSTLAQLLRAVLEHGFGLRLAVVSIDDYYLTRAQRAALASGVHSLLVTRGVPGTHDVPALHAALRQLRELGPAQALELFRFSKAQDDRMDQTQQWTGPLDVVLFEGWCVGARPETEAELQEPINALEASEDSAGHFRRFVNEQLAQGYADLWRELDMLVYLAAPNMDAVRAFRGQQEDELRALAAPGASGVMDGPALQRFVQHFERVSASMLRTAPGYADVVLSLDASRSCRLTRRNTDAGTDDTDSGN